MDDAKPGAGAASSDLASAAGGMVPVRASDTALPLYQAVKRQITDAVMLGTWPAGTVLPNEIALAARFGVAVGTLRRALADLTAEGLLARRRKTGTVVTGRTPQHSLRFLFRYFRLHGKDGALQESQSYNLSLERGQPTQDERRQLQLVDETEVIRFLRLRCVDGRPIMRDLFVFAAHRVPGFASAPQDAPPLLYQHLLDHYGIRISAVREHIRAELAGATVGADLGIAASDPILVIEEVAYDQANTPTILALHHATTQNHRYVNEIR